MCETCNVPTIKVERGRVVGIATRYGLDGPRDRIPVSARFYSPLQAGSGALQASCTVGTVYLSRG
jgi:hypothetical protein